MFYKLNKNKKNVSLSKFKLYLNLCKKKKERRFTRILVVLEFKHQY